MYNSKKDKQSSLKEKDIIYMWRNVLIIVDVFINMIKFSLSFFFKLGNI